MYVGRTLANVNVVLMCPCSTQQKTKRAHTHTQSLHKIQHAISSSTSERCLCVFNKLKVLLSIPSPPSSPRPPNQQQFTDQQTTRPTEKKQAHTHRNDLMLLRVCVHAKILEKMLHERTRAPHKRHIAHSHTGGYCDTCTFTASVCERACDGVRIMNDRNMNNPFR